MYQVSISIQKHGRKYDEGFSIPTFYLNENLQGILDANQACYIASRMFANIAKKSTFHITAFNMEYPDNVCHAEYEF